MHSVSTLSTNLFNCVDCTAKLALSWLCTQIEITALLSVLKLLEHAQDTLCTNIDCMDTTPAAFSNWPGAHNNPFDPSPASLSGDSHFSLGDGFLRNLQPSNFPFSTLPTTRDPLSRPQRQMYSGGGGEGSSQGMGGPACDGWTNPASAPLRAQSNASNSAEPRLTTGHDPDLSNKVKPLTLLCIECNVSVMVCWFLLQRTCVQTPEYHMAV